MDRARVLIVDPAAASSGPVLVSAAGPDEGCSAPSQLDAASAVAECSASQPEVPATVPAHTGSRRREAGPAADKAPRVRMRDRLAAEGLERRGRQPVAPPAAYSKEEEDHPIWAVDPFAAARAGWQSAGQAEAAQTDARDFSRSPQAVD